MSRDAQALLALLPALYRVRDAEIARQSGLERGPLEELLAVFAEQIAAVDEQLEQLYEDLFIETCADWVVPYIGDLIGYQALSGSVPDAASMRAEVAHTIALRRRKGTASVLEQLARDVTGWDAHAREYFQRLGTTQYMNHVRRRHVQCPDLRRGDALEWVGTAFDPLNHTVDVRRIESGRGRYNIPNVGLHLWRIASHSRRDAPALRHAPGRYRASPLGLDVPLYARPRAEDDITQLASPDNVPWPLSRRRLASELDRHYGQRADLADPLDPPDASVSLTVDGEPVSRDRIRVCDLSDSDDAGNWAHTPAHAGTVAIDPVLGRIALPPEAPADASVQLTWHEGFVADFGGGEYARADGFTGGAPDTRVPDDHATLADAIAAIGGSGVVEISDNGRHQAPATVALGGDIEIRAADGRRPVLDLAQPLSVTGAGTLTLDGMLLLGGLRVPDDGDPATTALVLRHCTLRPPGVLSPVPGDPSVTASVLVLKANAEVRLVRSIAGAIRTHDGALVLAEDSVVDAGQADAVAFAAAGGDTAGGTLSLRACTVIGRVFARAVGVISNSILFAAALPSDPWPAPVRSLARQSGCVRFSWLPWGSVMPPRYRCQPDSETAARHVAPRFVSLDYGTPAYVQLAPGTPAQILRGADDESEMGALHHLYAPQRVTNLRVRLREYLRVGLDAGIFYES